MCELCSDNEKERKSAALHHDNIANRLELLAAGHRKLASGEMKPHTDKASLHGALASSVIKYLAEAWL